MRSEEAQAGVCANGEKGGSPVRDGRLQRSRILVAPHEDAVGVDVWRPLHNTSSAALLSAFGLGRVPYRPQPQCLASEAFYKVSYEKRQFFVSRALFQRSQEWGKGTLHKSSRRRRCRIFDIIRLLTEPIFLGDTTFPHGCETYGLFAVVYQDGGTLCHLAPTGHRGS